MRAQTYQDWHREQILGRGYRKRRWYHRVLRLIAHLVGAD